MIKTNYLWMSVLAVSLLLPITSCGDDDNSEEPKQELPTNPNAATRVLTVSEQKTLMENIGKEFLGNVKASDFQGFKDLSDQLKEVNSDEVNDWADDGIDAITTLLSTHVESVDTFYTSVDITKYETYSRVYKLSAFTGHFELQNDKWVRTDADDLQFIFMDKNNVWCVAKVTSSGSQKQLPFVSTEDYSYEQFSSDNGFDIYESTYKTYEDSIVVPEKMSVSLTQGTQELASLNVTTNISMLGDSYDLSNDKYEISAALNVNGLVFNLKKAKYTPTKAEVSVAISKSGKSLLSMSASVDGTFSNDDPNVSQMNVSIDMLGRMQIVGTCQVGCSKRWDRKVLVLTAAKAAT